MSHVLCPHANAAAGRGWHRRGAGAGGDADARGGAARLVAALAPPSPPPTHPPLPRQPITPCARPPSADEAADLAAVDHAFVASEASALLRRVASASRTIYRDAYGSGRRGSGVADACVTALADVECEARSLHSVATSPAPFDAAVVLRRLYSLDEATRTAQAVARAGTAPSPEGGLGGGGGGGSGDGHAYADGEPDHAPPPHIFDLGAALEAARASGGRRRRSR